MTNLVKLLDSHWAAEYGFPSTHVMAVTAEAGSPSFIAIKFDKIYRAAMVVYYTYIQDYAGKNEYPLGFAILCCIPIIAATFFGRVYYGAHTFVDVIGGVVLALAIFWMFYPFAFTFLSLTAIPS